MAFESLLWFLIVLAVFGLIVGAIARLLVPGPTPLGIGGTMAAGVLGALIGGVVGRVLFGPSLTQGWTLVLSILGATLVVALASRRRWGYGGGFRRPLWGHRGYHDRAGAGYDVDRSYRPAHDVDRSYAYADAHDVDGPYPSHRAHRFGGAFRSFGRRRRY